MAIGDNEKQRSAVPLQDPDGRLIVVGPNGVPISGGAGGGGADPLSDGSDAGALPTKTLWVAGADGAVLRGLRVDASGRARVVVEGTPAVSVSNFPGSQAVTGPLTDAQLRASNVPVSGPVTDTQLRASAVPVSGPLTDTQLRASAVPVSGPLTDTQLRASAVPVTDSRLPAALVGGRLDVNIGAAPQVAVNNVETLADNAAFTDGTSKLFPQGYIFDEAAGTALTENDIAAARVDSKRSVVNVLEDATTRGQRAIITTLGALLNAGDTAHDAVDAGNPVKTGAKASWPAVPTLTASGDRTNNWSDLAGAQIVRKRPVVTYSAMYRLANATAGARPLSTGVLTANTNKQIATIYHTVSATKRVQIKYVSVTLYFVATAAGTIEFEIVTLSSTTAPATGAPAIIPSKVDQGDAAAEVTCLALPGTQGSVVNADQPLGDLFVGSYGITGAGSTVAPPPSPALATLWDSRDMGDGKDLIMRAGSAEGYAVIARSTTAGNIFSSITIIFTEE